jgi:hypothetical protein
MAKRQRGSARPGQRAPLQRGSQPAAQPAATPAAKPVAATSPGGLSDGELDRAAELEAQIVAEERAAATSMTRGRDRRRSGSDAAAASRSRTAGSLAVAAEEEYRFVMHDLRRIAVVFAGIFSILIASWLLIVALAF